MAGKPASENIPQSIREVERKSRQYKHIVETTGSIVGLVDQNYVYQYVNSAYCAAFKKDRQEIIGLTVADLFGQEMFDQTIKPHYECCFAGEEVTYQAWVEFAGWGDRYMNVHYSPFFNSERKVTAVVVSAHDITEIKQLEIKLEESEEELQANLDAWLESCNNDRPLSGRYCRGKTPMQTFIDSRHIAQEKMLNNTQLTVALT